MDNEVYSPPQSNLLTETDLQQNTFYVVSRLKFSLLLLATYGLYSVYWFYRNWRTYKDATGTDLWPVPRAIFYIFFTHSLFSQVDDALKEREIDHQWYPNALATLFVLVAILSNVLDRLAMREVGSPYTDMVSLLVLPVMLLILLPAQTAINTSQGDPAGTTNKSFTVYNILWMAAGGLLWVLTFAGLWLVYSGGATA